LSQHIRQNSAVAEHAAIDDGAHGGGHFLVELLESLAEAEVSRVVVTWIHPAEPVDLSERGIDESQAADLRHRLAPFAEDWNRPEMAAYDELPTR
jgi:hypothetical protein